jgi:hypothetical protein
MMNAEARAINGGDVRVREMLSGMQRRTREALRIMYGELTLKTVGTKQMNKHMGYFRLFLAPARADIVPTAGRGGAAKRLSLDSNKYLH